MSAARAGAAAAAVAAAGAGVETVHVEREGAVARVVLDRPPLNVLSTEMLRELDGALEAVATEDAVSVVLLTGAGKAFCAGADVADHTSDRVADLLATFHGALRRLTSLPQPVVCAANGATLGGGLELALACDIVLVREGATLGLPEVRLGVFPPYAAVALPGRIGEAAAMDLILSGRKIDASEAVRLGLASRAFAAWSFEADVEAYTQGLASLSRPVLRLAKRALRTATGAGLPSALQAAERLYLDELMGLDDAHEGLAAFLEKRTPRWRHR